MNQYNLVVDDNFVNVVHQMADLALKANGIKAKEAVDFTLAVLNTRSKVETQQQPKAPKKEKKIKKEQDVPMQENEDKIDSE